MTAEYLQGYVFGGILYAAAFYNESYFGLAKADFHMNWATFCSLCDNRVTAVSDVVA